jgi:hypothetical protein
MSVRCTIILYCILLLETFLFDLCRGYWQVKGSIFFAIIIQIWKHFFNGKMRYKTLVHFTLIELNLNSV